MRIGFDRDKYLRMQSSHIAERRAQFGGKLYLEFGGKLIDDMHASRVLPGFTPDNKIVMLAELADEVEIVMAVNAKHLARNKVRADLGIPYEDDLLRHIDAFRSYGLYVGSVVVTQWTDDNRQAQDFKRKLEALGITVYRHFPIPGYPGDVARIVSAEGYGRNEYIETRRDLVVVTAPGPGSGKMATCLSQIYHDHQRGISSGYAKFETFPIWNLPLDHPVISDDEVCRQAACQEIIRRYYRALVTEKREVIAPVQSQRIALLMAKVGVSKEDRPVVPPALEVAEATGEPASAIELPDGRIVTGKTSALLGCSSAMLLNALKLLAGIDDDVNLLAPASIEPIQKLKTQRLGSRNPRLHTDEVLIALAVSANGDDNARKALDQLETLRGCEVHTSTILGSVDEGIFRALGVQVTNEPVYATKSLYRKK